MSVVNIISAESAYKSARFLNLMFLLAHLILLAVFWVYRYKYMVYINTVSVAFYASGFWMIDNKRLYEFTHLVCLEVSIYMTLGIVLMGWDMGYQLMFIVLSILMYYAEYFASKVGIRKVRGTVFCVIECLLFLCLYIYHFFHEPYYNCNVSLMRYLYQMMIVYVFVVIGYFMTTFIRYARALEDMVYDQARRDSLTGLYNRIGIKEILDKIDTSDLPKYCVTIFDIDDFKNINDTYGHNCGDYVIKTISQIALENSGESKVARWGGEEFVLITPIEDSLDRVFEMNEDIRKKIAATRFMFENREIRQITITMGMQQFEEDMDFSKCVGIADEKLYSGKQKGKNLVIM